MLSISAAAGVWQACAFTIWWKRMKSFSILLHDLVISEGRKVGRHLLVLGISYYPRAVRTSSFGCRRSFGCFKADANVVKSIVQRRKVAMR